MTFCEAVATPTPRYHWERPINTMPFNTQDGYLWTPSTGTKKGDLPCRGVIYPSTRVQAPANHLYDALVIGAGYAGLCAARDLTEAGTYQSRRGILQQC